MRIKLTIILLSVVLLSACGYHLRGAYNLPQQMKNIYLKGGSADFRSQLLSVLNSSKGHLVDSPEKADVVLIILHDNIERRAISLSQRGRSNQIELAERVDYELRDAKNEVVVANEPINIRREYFNDQQDVIAKDNEEVVIKNEMYQQAVRAIINRGRNVMEAKKAK